MSTRYPTTHPHARPPSRRQPLGPGDARANIHTTARPIPTKPHPASQRRPVPPTKHGVAPASPEATRTNHARNAQQETRGSKRVSDIKTNEHNSKRDSEFSNASSSGSGPTRKSTIGQWQLGKTIGRGGCSTVRLVRHLSTGQQGAVKIISRKMAEAVRAQSLANLAMAQEQSVADLVAAGKLQPPPPGLLREIAIMKLLDHPNIVRLYDVWENHNELYLIMEYVKGGELFHYVEECRGLDEMETVYIFRQIVAALLYCHRMHIHHRDLKPENILLDRDNAQVKLVDFGMAALQPEGKQLTTACGSPHYAAPEVIKSKPYDGAKADVWSCGVILYVMLTGTTPFNSDHERNLAVMYAAIQSADYYMPSDLSVQAKDLLRKIFVTRPEKRISMDEIWDHPLLHKYDQDFGYQGDLAKKERWIGPAATLDEWAVTREEDIDKEILRNMRTLWHSVPQPILIKKLLSPQPNQEKFFYAALAKHKDEHLENYTGLSEGQGYAASDYQHARADLSQSTAPQTKQTSHSSYSIMNNEHLRSSSIAEPMPTEPVPDKYKTGGAAPVRGPSHKRGNSGAARVEMLKKANSGARHARAASVNKNSPAQGGRSRSRSVSSVSRNSRQSLTSSIWPSSPPVVVHVKTQGGHKRNVSFQHVRKASTSAKHSRTGSNADEEAVTVEHEVEVPEIVEEQPEEEDESSTQASSPSQQVSHGPAQRKSKAPTGILPRSKPRAQETPGQFIRTEVRKVSTELEQACEEAFFRSSYGSTTNHTASTDSVSDRQLPYETPPSSVSNHQTSAAAYSSTGRPLPAVPSDAPNTFIARTLEQLEETRKELVARSINGADAARISEMMASLEKMIPQAAEAERRSTSAPEPKSAAEMGFLPIITEEPLPDTLRVGKIGSDRNLRSFTAPGQVRESVHDKVREVEEVSIGRPVVKKRDSSMEKEAVLSRPKTSDGQRQNNIYLQVPSPHDYFERKKSHDSAIGFRPTEELTPVTTTTSGNSTEPAEKKSFWSRRWKKLGAASPPASSVQPASRPESQVSAPASFEAQDVAQPKPSIIQRDKRPPPLNLSNVGHAQPAILTDGSEFPIRKASESEKQGLKGWLNRRQKKDEIKAIEIKDPMPSPSIQQLSQPPTPAAVPVPPSPAPVASPPEPSPPAKQTSPTTPVAPVNAVSWFSRFFRVAPHSHVTAFNVPRSRARTEIYRLLREFQHHGLADLCYFPQENAITARVDRTNALGVKPVSFRVELYVVLQNGRKSGLSLGRWTQTRGAASAFDAVVKAVGDVLDGRGIVVEEGERRRELVSILA